MARTCALLITLMAAATLAACGPAAEEEAPAAPAPEPAPQEPTAPPTPASLPNGIMLALAQFVAEPGPDGKPRQVPGPARLEFLFRLGGAWQSQALEDPESNVFHKAMIYRGADGPAILTLGGTAAILKTWTQGEEGPEATSHWHEDFGGKHSRMRDAEVGDLFGDGSAAVAVATHDQGVVAVLRPRADAGFEVLELDRQIEIGDLDGDGVLEVYATPSEPNKLDGTPQPGKVVRYVPQRGEGRVVTSSTARHSPARWFATSPSGAKVASSWPTWETATPRRSWWPTSTATGATSSTSPWRDTSPARAPPSSWCIPSRSSATTREPRPPGAR
jgi:hypothetical protein